MSNTALVLGATGYIGQFLLNRLIRDDDWDRIIVVTRRSLNLDTDKVVEVIATPETISEVATNLAADTVFCCLGTTLKKAGGQANFRKIDHDYIVDCARIAHQQGATRFLLVSSVGAKVGSSNFYTHVKGETERDIAAIGFESLDILRPSLLLGARGESRPMEDLGRTIAPILSKFLIGPMRKYRPIEGEQVAKAMAAIEKKKQNGVQVHTYDSLMSF